MLKRYLSSIGLILISLMILLSCIGCALTVHACDVIENDLVDIDSQNQNDNSCILRIGQSTYDTQYLSSKKSSLTDEIYNVYGIVEESSNLIRSRIRTNAKTGAIVGFSNVTPYSNIDNIEKLTDEKLKEVVELMMGDLVDFSKFNEFEIKRPHSSNSVYYLLWQVKRDLLCNIKVEVYITANGLITNFDKTDACPDDLAKSFVNNAERDKLFEQKIIAHLAIDSIKDIKYEIQSEVLSYYKNTPAIIYNVNIIENGFEQLITFVVY